MKTAIIAGCGGGYDIFGGLIKYHQLKDTHRLILCNLSFTSPFLLRDHCEEIIPKCFKVTPEGDLKINSKIYCPEYLLAKELQIPVYVMCGYDTVEEIRNFYLHLLREVTIDEIYLVDGGCDVLLTGTESELGTPVKNMMHLKAILDLPISTKIVCAVGLNVDCGHGVVESELEERLSKTKFESRLLTLDEEDCKFYYNTFNKCNPRNSIVHSLVCSSLEDSYGYVIPKHLQKRISEAKVNVSDLTRLFIECDMNELSIEIVYLDKITDTMTSDEVDSLMDSLIDSL